MEPIDAVYTWVDGSQPDYVRLREEWARRLGVRTNPERDRDDLQILRYSLRSLEAFAPWIHRIFLVTMRPQVPGWLDRSRAGERLQIVHHDQIFRNAEDLPTFNSNAIDFHLKNIPGLGPLFLYFNDDYLLGRPLLPRHLFSRGGRIRVYLPSAPIPGPESAPLDLWGSILHSTGQLLDRLHGRQRRAKHEHTPCLIRKGWVEDHDPAIRRTLAARFRTAADIAFETYYSHTLLAEHPEAAERVPAWEFALTTSFFRLRNRLEDLPGMTRQLRWKRPRFFCLNDDMGPCPDPEFLRRVRDFLDRTYPRRSAWERQ